MIGLPDERCRTFAYGMNMEAEGMPDGALRIGPALLRGWRLDFRHYADVQPGTLEDVVPGVVWEIDNMGLAHLDMREGFRGPDEANLYDRVEVGYERLLGDDGTAWVYTMQEVRPLDPPAPWYLDLIAREYERFNLPTGPLADALARVNAAPRRRA